MTRLALLAGAALLLTGCAHKCDWLGAPGVAKPDKYFLHDGFVTSIEIGICEGGAVRWRKAP